VHKKKKGFYLQKNLHVTYFKLPWLSQYIYWWHQKTD